MTLSESAKESLEIIRRKVMRKDYDFDKTEAMALAYVWGEIQFLVSGKKRVLQLGCHSCLCDASNIVLNYINQYEPRIAPNMARVTEIKVNKLVETIVLNPSELESTFTLTLSELRQKFPHIKATSVKVFLQKLADEKTTSNI